MVKNLLDRTRREHSQPLLQTSNKGERRVLQLLLFEATNRNR